MPRYSTIHISDPKEWFSCLVTNCTAKFRSMNGRTQHIRAKHTSDTPAQQLARLPNGVSIVDQIFKSTIFCNA